MMILLLTLGVLISFSHSSFVGILMWLMVLIFFLADYEIFGLDCLKGDLYGGLGLDFISYYMVLLLVWLMSLILVLFYSHVLCLLLLILMFSMLMMFICLDLVFLFIFFEFSMLPMFMIIMFMGTYKERYGAVMYMFIYTIISSLPMLVMLMLVYSVSGSVNIDYMGLDFMGLDVWVVVGMVFMFLVKVPMFIIHMWLPKAHVEAPVYGSMILASVMLKMGGYGIVRCLSFVDMGVSLGDFFFCFCLCGSLIIGYTCLYQVDLKVLVAYSSIIHMGMMLMGFFSGGEMGYLGGIVMMLSHGICSSGMFYLVNEIYLITGSRLFTLNKGAMSGVPILMWLWLLLLMCNLGVPPCFGILGELMLIGGCLGYSFFLFCFYIILIFFVSCFVMGMFSFMVGGVFMFRFVSVSVSTYYGAMIHLIPLNGLIFFLYAGF